MIYSYFALGSIDSDQGTAVGMVSAKGNIDIDTALAELAEEILSALADRFPVCMASDEFHFFPQYRPARIPWSRWDDFSSEGLKFILARFSQWQGQIEQWQGLELELAPTIDLEILTQVLLTIQEQLVDVRPHKTQPTFYLTIASIGLSDALEDSPEAFSRRIATLPKFLQMARHNLEQVPVRHNEQGIIMARKLREWIQGLSLTHDEWRQVGAALDEFRSHLEGIETTHDFRLPRDLYARMVKFHLGCRMDLEEIRWQLEQEIEEAEQALSQNAARISPGESWLAVWQTMPVPSVAPGDVTDFYLGVIGRLKSHCLEQRFFSAEAMAGCEVAVETIPEHLMPVRANAAYSMPAGYPPKGGTFYLMPQGHQNIARDMLLLSAHETFPGHHLLDTLRWQHERLLRRSVEFPLFYEGWACFAEEILFDSDFFSGPADRLMMAKRRLWRAHRGMADLMVHCGKSTIEEAAEALGQVGLVSRAQAMTMVQRYALKPGYQLAYTIGRRKFRQLYTAFLGSGRTPAQFVRHVLSEGEIGFERLAERLLD